MPTNDNEFFRSAVTDEWNTPRPLTGPEQEETAAQQQFGQKRKRKARKAFGLAAPVAVVAVTVTLAAAMSACPVCGKEQCNYFYNFRELPAQILYEEDVPVVQPETSDAENRLTCSDYSFEGVEAWSDYLFLEMDGQTAGIPDNPLSFLLYENQIDYLGRSGNSFTDEESGARLVFQANLRDEVPVVYVELVYLPQGGSPGETDSYGEMYLENMLAQGRQYTYAVKACEQPNLWMRAYSIVPEVTAQQVLEAVGDPLVLPFPGSRVDVGSSLYMTLPVSQYLWSAQLNTTFYSYGYLYQDADPVIGETINYIHSPGPVTTEYRFTSNDPSVARFSVEFAARDWNAVVDAWNALYRQAPLTGHEQWSLLVPQQSITVNQVTYDVYLNFLKVSRNGSYQCSTVWFVPRQQPTCMISCYIYCPSTTEPLALSGKNLDEVVSSGEMYMDVLSLFYPAGAQAEPIATPTPAPTPAPTPTAAPAEEETEGGIALSNEFPYALPDMSQANVGDYAWISSHSIQDYSLEQLAEANRVSSLVSPGSGRTLVTVRKAFETQADLSGPNAVVTPVEEPYSNTVLYGWLDADGTLNWYRNTNGLGVDAYAVIRPDGLSFRYEWTEDGPTAFTIYPNRDTVFDRYDSNPLLTGSREVASAFDYDPQEPQWDFGQYTVGSSYQACIQAMSQSTFDAFGDTRPYELDSAGRMYDLYLDDNMHLLSALYTYFLGIGPVTPDYTVFGVVEETPDLTPVLEAFDRLDQVECALNVNGSETSLPLYAGIETHIALYVDGATITADLPVEQQGGSSVSIPDDGAFLPPDQPVNISVRYGA